VARDALLAAKYLPAALRVPERKLPRGTDAARSERQETGQVGYLPSQNEKATRRP
jgi:hypothetical protein